MIGTPLLLSEERLAPRRSRARDTVNQPVDILLIEDGEGDILLTMAALTKTRVANRLSVVGDGRSALEFLHRRGPFGSAPRPGLILLDLDLPEVDGLLVLAELKRDAELRRIPVIVHSASRDDADVTACYDLNANGYIAKPTGTREFLEVFTSIVDFWLRTATLPPV